MGRTEIPFSTRTCIGLDIKSEYHAKKKTKKGVWDSEARVDRAFHDRYLIQVLGTIFFFCEVRMLGRGWFHHVS